MLVNSSVEGSTKESVSVSVGECVSQCVSQDVIQHMYVNPYIYELQQLWRRLNVLLVQYVRISELVMLTTVCHALLVTTAWKAAIRRLGRVRKVSIAPVPYRTRTATLLLTSDHMDPDR